MSEFKISVLIILEKMLFSGEIYTAGKNFYTAASSDGIDKSHLWMAEFCSWVKNEKKVKVNQLKEKVKVL